ncbi:MAG: hypothetical protein M1834_006082 [Cirrosporium novae-zelandiae]|nr:MAG: hypothetical protein M1834_006082 [Cirrosporium novae-zelandiae]
MPDLHLLDDGLPNNMPHATEPKKAQNDDDDFNKLMGSLAGNDGEFEFQIPDLGPTEKAEDAIDYEDIDDDDLADEEYDEVEGGAVQPLHSGKGLERDSSPGLDGLFEDGALPEGDGDGAGDIDFDDLFGDGSPPAPEPEVATEPGALTQPTDLHNSLYDHVHEALRSPSPDTTDQLPPRSPLFSRPGAEDDVPMSREQQLQQQLFAMSRVGIDIPPAPPQNLEELLASLWPKFEKARIPRFLELLPPKKAHYVGKTPLKIPKTVRPTKVNIEIAPEQEKLFRLNAVAGQQPQVQNEENGLIPITVVETNEQSSDVEDIMDIDQDDDVGGVGMNDLRILCADWDTFSLPSDTEDERETVANYPKTDDIYADFMDDPFQPPVKRHKSNVIEEILSTPRFAIPPSFDNFEQATQKLAKRVTLDLNDPHLLVDIRAPETTPRKRTFGDFRKDVSGSLTKKLFQRFNQSNDESYDHLKENHQNKVRSTLGNLSVVHSMPAQRLQWPYYRTKLGKVEARTFHRPKSRFHPGVTEIFSQPNIVKRKNRRNKDAPSLFATTKDLSLGDNSSALLLEYSEEHPISLSNFGMGNRLVNYYRRKNVDDDSRPKLDLGETNILMPQDKSPFSIFGHIDPGEITPTLHNAMFKAPVFKQEPKSTDFLFIKSTTGVQGSRHYLRNIENLVVVGQQFPSVDVPGPHSRKVTTAAKNRLKMVSYRIIKRKPSHRIGVAEVTKHFPETTDMQNRQKMKEFMQFSKEHKEWEMRSGESIPEEDTVRALIKPEDVCLLESMQVGQQHLMDSGYSKEDEESDNDDEKEGPSIEQQLAPWHTTRNFINATQGKAMLQLHGEGDPSGRGEAFSFIKTSMKGGFKAIGESANDKLDAAKQKELGGHSYNVARQQKAYEDSIRRIWDSQKASLSSTIEHSDADMDIDNEEEQDGLYTSAPTPRSTVHTPAAFSSRHDDESMSQFSRFSTSSQNGKVLRLTRKIKNKRGEIETVQEVIKDHRVIKQYMKRRREKEVLEMTITDLKPTGDAEQDKAKMKLVEKELARLQRNKERRLARDKQKGLSTDAVMSPGSPATPGPKEKPTGTQRKLCPLLNGTMKQEDTFSGSAFSLGNEPPTM